MNPSFEESVKYDADLDLSLHAIEAQHLAHGHYRPRVTMQGRGIAKAVHAGLDGRIDATAAALEYWEVDGRAARDILGKHLTAAIDEINERLI